MGRNVEAICFTRYDRADLLLDNGELVENAIVSVGTSFGEGAGGCAAVALAKSSKARPNSLPEDPDIRNSYPMADGLLDYFPNALAEVSRVSYHGNQQHNPGQPMHWARGKSTDHRNKILRHLIDAGGKDAKGIRHSAYLAWRALANLQQEIEDQEGVPMSRGSKPA